jgi:hypothetical protein
MPRKNRNWEIIRDGDTEYLVLFKDGQPVKIDNFDEIYNIVTTCPKCGAKATGFSLHKRNYSGSFVQGRTYEFYYLAHYFNNDKHMWYLGPVSPLTTSIVERISASRPAKASSAPDIPEDKKQLLYKVFIKKKGFSREEAELARQIFLRLIGLQK